MIFINNFSGVNRWFILVSRVERAFCKVSYKMDFEECW